MVLHEVLIAPPFTDEIFHSVPDTVDLVGKAAAQAQSGDPVQGHADGTDEASGHGLRLAVELEPDAVDEVSGVICGIAHLPCPLPYLRRLFMATPVKQIEVTEEGGIVTEGNLVLDPLDVAADVPDQHVILGKQVPQLDHHQFHGGSDELHFS